MGFVECLSRIRIECDSQPIVDPAKFRQREVTESLPEGTVLRGVADLVLEIDDGLVLLDHKSFPGNPEQARERAGSYAGQLSAYAAALAEATKRPVLAAYIHLPVSGLVIEVGFPS